MDVPSTSDDNAAQERLQPCQHPLPPACLLFGLPAPAAEALVAHLPEAARKCLRLVAHAALKLVDTNTLELWRHCSAGALLTPLPLRCPRVGKLILRGSREAFGQYAAQEDLAQLAGAHLCRAQQGPWASVTSLQLLGMTAAAAVVAIASCPNVAKCTLMPPWSTEDAAAGDAQRLRTLQHVCGGALPRLRKLRVPLDDLNSDDVMAIASCTSITRLRMSLGHTCGPDARAALLSMQLQDLLLVLQGGLLGAAEQAGLRRMTSLTALHMAGQQLWQVYPSLASPPTSLVSLCVDAHAPRGPWDVVLLGEQPEFIASLATKCPALASLELPLLGIGPHAATLAALTKLTVTDRLVASEGARLAAVCPKLQQLSLQGAVQLGGNAVFFENLASLQALVLGDRDGRNKQLWHVNMEASLLALATLPQLTELQCLGLQGHIRACRMLPRLRHIEITFNPGHCAYVEPVRDALRTATLPATVQRVRLMFHSGTDSDERVQPFYEAIVHAAPLFLVRASGLSTVIWDDHLEVAGVTDVALWALASIPTVKHITVHGWRYEPFADAMLHHIRALHGNRPLAVVVEGDDVDAD